MPAGCQMLPAPTGFTRPFLGYRRPVFEHPKACSTEVYLVRPLAAVVLFGGFACAQVAPSAAPLVAKNGSVSPNTTSSTISLNDQTSRPLADLPPQPKGKTTLLGGRIRVVDLVRDRLILDVFGGGHTAVLFDERTHVFSEGKEGSLDELKNGDRAYVDTTLDGKDVFARNIRVIRDIPTGEGSGQIVGFESARGELTLRDTLSPRPVKMHLAPNVVIKHGDQPGTIADLQPGALVKIQFIPGAERQAMVREVSILASPGAHFVFSGSVAHLDLHRGLLVIEDPRDNKSYEVHLDSTNRKLTRNIQEGADVSVEASFDGSRYEARSVTVNAASSNQEQK
jgi:hypothetical protein